jgi:hypothetical protein
MSGALAAGTQLFSVGTQAIAASGIPLPAFIRAQRMIDTIIPDVTIGEHHNDRLAITQNPVADGSPTSDHAYMMPATVTMRLGWTNSNPIAGIVQGIQGLVSGAGGIEGLFSTFTESRCRDIYDQMRALQRSRTPFDLTTGKRQYNNMLIAEITVSTDRHSEYALMLELRLQQITVVKIQSTTQPALANQGLPQQTASPPDPQSGGTTQPQPVENPDSLLKQNWDGLKTGIGGLFG